MVLNEVKAQHECVCHCFFFHSKSVDLKKLIFFFPPLLAMLRRCVVAEPQIRSRYLKNREHRQAEPPNDLIGLAVVAAATAAADAAAVLGPHDGSQLASPRPFSAAVTLARATPVWKHFALPLMLSTSSTPPLPTHPLTPPPFLNTWQGERCYDWPFFGFVLFHPHRARMVWISKKFKMWQTYGR